MIDYNIANPWDKPVDQQTTAHERSYIKAVIERDKWKAWALKARDQLNDCHKAFTENWCIDWGVCEQLVKEFPEDKELK